MSTRYNAPDMTQSLGRKSQTNMRIFITENKHSNCSFPVARSFLCLNSVLHATLNLQYDTRATIDSYECCRRASPSSSQSCPWLQKHLIPPSSL